MALVGEQGRLVWCTLSLPGQGPPRPGTRCRQSSARAQDIIQCIVFLFAYDWTCTAAQLQARGVSEIVHLCVQL